MRPNKKQQHLDYIKLKHLHTIMAVGQSKPIPRRCSLSRHMIERAIEPHLIIKGNRLVKVSDYVPKGGDYHDYDDRDLRLWCRNNNPSLTDNFIKYLCNSFLINYDDFKSNWGKATFYEQLRREPRIDITYSNNLHKKAIQISKKLSDIRVSTLLDIGTEDPEYLDHIEIELNCVATGLNIGNVVPLHHTNNLTSSNTSESSCDNVVWGQDPTFDHYGGELSSRIWLYNGIHIPFGDNSFDVVTIISVLHHVSDEHMPLLAAEIARVCKERLIIKDNDLGDEEHKVFCRLQHSMYEGGLVPGKPNYLNYNVTMESTLDIFKQYFTVIDTHEVGNFNGAYWCDLLKKVDQNTIF